MIFCLVAAVFLGIMVYNAVLAARIEKIQAELAGMAEDQITLAYDAGYADGYEDGGEDSDDLDS